jgi:hypothetical protein
VTEVRAVEASREAIADVAALLATAFPRAQLGTERLAWDYLGNPLGRTLLAQAFAGERLAATLAGRRLRATFGGRTSTGILIHHAATHPEFRRRGLLGRAIDALAASARAAGAAFAVAVLNQNSVSTFLGRGGFAALRPLSARLAFGPLELREAAPRPLDCVPLRDPDWLAWRLAAPGARYAIRRRGRRTEIWADSGVLGIPVLLGDAPADAIDARLTAFASRTPLRLWVGRDPDGRLAAPLSIDLPLALRPSPLHLVFRPLAEGAAAPAPERIRFDALDFDAW